MRLLCVSDPAFQLLRSHCTDSKLIELFIFGDYLDGKKCSFDVYR